MKPCLIVLALSASLAYGAGSTLYSPNRSIADQGIQLKAWGSGTIAETDEIVFQGTKSIRVSTRNYFQGGHINFAKPTSLAGEFGNKDNLLMFQFRTSSSSTVIGSGAGGRNGGGSAGAELGGGGPPAPGRGGGPGGLPGRGGSAGGAAAAPSVLKNVRLILTTSDGLKSEVFAAIPAGSDKAWRPLGIPLQSFAGFDKTNKEVVSIALSGDATSSFYIGEVTVSNDSTPISGDLNRTDLNLGLNDEVEFIGNGYGGATPLVYTWDFDSADGIQVDAEGQSVKRRFRKAGTYTITLTISDLYGLKKPFTRTCKVTVNP